eukprot:865087_1
MSNLNELVNKLKAVISAKIGNDSKTNDDSDTLLIVKCLGGIDDILLHYIQHNIMVELGVQKNEEIYHILTRRPTIDQNNKPISTQSNCPNKGTMTSKPISTQSNCPNKGTMTSERMSQLMTALAPPKATAQTNAQRQNQ